MKMDKTFFCDNKMPSRKLTSHGAEGGEAGVNYVANKILKYWIIKTAA